MNFQTDIIAVAQSYGVDPALALAVARQESGIMQYRADGSLLVGSAGEVGIFQVMPSSAPGVNLSDPKQNIRAGIHMLSSLYSSFGTWPLALAAYNWGEGHLRQAMRGKLTIPASVSRYVAAVLGTGKLWETSSGTTNPAVIAAGLIFGIGVFLLVLR